MRTLYASTPLGSAPAASSACALVAVPTLLRALILDLIDLQANGKRPDREAHVVALIADEVRALSVAPLCVPRPREARLRAICDALAAEPGSELTATAWATRFGLSAKTLERDFQRSFGITFGCWRQHVRLLTALDGLAAGRSVIDVALDLGYQSPSAFSAMFRRILGTSPSRYFA
jgi:AraC-like DNA-binding protein